jgi:hypothetical protein
MSASTKTRNGTNVLAPALVSVLGCDAALGSLSAQESEGVAEGDGQN